MLLPICALPSAKGCASDASDTVSAQKGWVAHDAIKTAALAREPDHVVVRVVAHRTERRELRDVEVHAAAGFVGVAPLEHLPDEPADVGNGRRRSRRAVHRQRTERLHVALEARLLARREVEVVHPEFAGLDRKSVV